MLRNVCVFCASNPGSESVYRETAKRLGILLAERNIRLVYGGSKLGLMGVIADACLTHGGHVAGVIPHALVDKEIAHRGLTELHVVTSMHERKALMADLADGFIALPGGYGTWEEFLEVLTWSQLGLHRKACALLNVNGYYDCLLRMVDRAAKDGFLKSAHREMLISGTDPEGLLEQLNRYRIPAVTKWVERAET